MRRAEQGRSAIELAVLVAVVAAALVGMGIYLQRGYQGYLRNTSQAHGVQFDPASFNEVRQLKSYQRNQTIDVTSAEASVPGIGGDVPGRILTTKVKTTTDWDVARNATYQAQ